MKLSELKTGEKASIVKVSGHGGFRKRIVEMGFVKGKVVEALLNAPLNDPIKYKVMGYEVSLRRSEAALIEVLSEEEVSQSMQASPETIVEEEQVRRAALDKRKSITIALVGNPNCGKTTLFNYASGGHEHVGNYSGVTVAAKEGQFDFRGYHITLVDLPGTYSISAYSPEERYVQQYIAERMPDVIINVVAASNLERNLYLTTQLIDMNLRTVVALNMYDELEASGDRLDYEGLGKLLGIPFVPTVARKRQGLDELMSTAIHLYEGSDVLDAEGMLIGPAQHDTLLDDYHHAAEMPHRHTVGAQLADLEGGEDVYETVRHIHINYGEQIEQSIGRLKPLLAGEHALTALFPPRYWSLKLLEKDPDAESCVHKLAKDADTLLRARDEEVVRLAPEVGEDIETYITDAKYGFISGALRETLTEGKREDKYRRTSEIDAVVTSKYFGYPLFLLFMFVMFQCTFWLGQYPMDWIEAGVGWLGEWLGGAMAPGPLRDLVVDGIIGGVGGVIVFLPNILILYFFISLMEDSGYMARAAFIMDKIMHRMGLHGKSFIPLIMGFGCNVPAVMATRTIENRNSRMITILVNPFMSCSARLPVYLLLAGAFFPQHAGLVLFGLYFTGIVLAVVMARLFKRFLFPKDETPFVMELPPYRVPTMRSIFIHTWEKGKQYLKKMGTVILLASIVIWFLGYYPRPAAEGELTAQEQMEQQANSYIGRIGHAIEPVMAPCGFDWKMSVALLSGVAAKEIVVSTLGVLYTGNADEDDATLTERIQSDTYPDGSPVFTPVVALAFMLFVLIYIPCIATIVAIKNEAGGWRWALFSAGYTLVLAWLAAFTVFQVFG